MNRRYSIVGAISLALVLVVAPSPALAQVSRNSNPGILPPNSTAFGNTYGGWSAAWWQYVFLQPASSNPLSDPTGASCTTGQSGPVFFLVGGFGSPAITITRDSCVVPAGKALFFPLVNAFDVHVACTPQTAGICDHNDTAQEVWNDLQNTPNGFSISELHSSIDGVPVSNLNPATTPYRACAGPVPGCAAPYTLTFPADNFFGLPAGAYAPAVADGVYLLLTPLAPGPHTINFGGTGFFSGQFQQDITYHLTVR
jgi:hypothetical protein